ncbi:deoxyribodipyrimidine photo-lyase [Brevundimonas sp. PAMC22021]|uniref:cryptochrome/photolyase family protein n=1 Tax=Brevundimonas sp. PAMC22021 TaxID=2861285 RepID=UPI001C62A574|nr:deoxyribodipyrimidine photo-lyase [Brevundimonas sp. PAMC22021]QYF88001.1 DNA photolyase family protein [Brevundimonas sp. PAMC22021]
MTERPILMWFRRDLRLADNPALEAARVSGRPITPVYILDDHLESRPIGAASRWWLDKSLRALSADIAGRGGRLILRRGDAEAELHRLVEDTGAEAMVFNRLYEPDARARDRDIAHALTSAGVSVQSFNGALLAEPDAVRTGAGGPYKVFTPYRRALMSMREAHPPSPVPAEFANASVRSDDIDAWRLHPSGPDWSSGFDWAPGEASAQAGLSQWGANAFADYHHGRDRPSGSASSRLSPRLHWGELAPWRVLDTVEQASRAGKAPVEAAEKFASELAWRDFSAHLLHHFPSIEDRAFRPAYDAMPWRDDPDALAAWKMGRTGYPMVDAGMRQLWTTGWMHNRVRMVTASFLVKHLLIDWREGERWFWDTLIDADRANNLINWQWVAGSGPDATPFFRIYNPVAQGQKFDAEGRYVRRWLPELARLPDRWLHAPWTAAAEALSHAGVRLGATYPRPIVDHAQARARALAALQSLPKADVED